MEKLKSILTILLLSLTTLGYAQEYYPALSDDWTLVWSDEFDYQGVPDPAKWQVIHGQFGWNQDLQYFSRGQNLDVRDGSLFIRTDIDGEGRFRSGGVQSIGRGEWLHGRLVVRARVPSALGLHPAIWMLPAIKRYDDQGAFYSGEIDLMEHVGYEPNTLYSAVQTGARNIALGNGDGGRLQVDNPGDFHLFELDWTPEYLEILVDGQLSYRLERGNGDLARWPFIHPYYLIIHVSMGGSWAGMAGLDMDALPLEMEVDYVRVYQQLPDASRHSIDVKAETGGIIVSRVPRRLRDGEPLVVTAQALEGYEFLRWQGAPWGTDNSLSFEVHQDIGLTALFQPLGNQLENPHFLWRARGWQYYSSLANPVQLSFPDQGLMISTVDRSENLWDSGLYPLGVYIEESQGFDVLIKAEVQEAQTIRVSLAQAQAPYGEYWGENLVLMPGVLHYRLSGISDTSDPEARLLIQLGHVDGEILLKECAFITE